jgi:hypothetical protein
MILRMSDVVRCSQQQIIHDTCPQNGWQGPVVYDGEGEDWDW